MNYVKLIYSDGGYREKESSNMQLWLLGWFFRIDVGAWAIDNFLAALRDPQILQGGGNTTSFWKEGDYTNIADDLGDEDNPITISVKTAVLIKLLEQWQELMKQKPEAIMITEENGVFAMHGCSDV